MIRDDSFPDPTFSNGAFTQVAPTVVFVPAERTIRNLQWEQQEQERRAKYADIPASTDHAASYDPEVNWAWPC